MNTQRVITTLRCEPAAKATYIKHHRAHVAKYAQCEGDRPDNGTMLYMLYVGGAAASKLECYLNGTTSCSRPASKLRAVLSASLTTVENHSPHHLKCSQSQLRPCPEHPGLCHRRFRSAHHLVVTKASTKTLVCFVYEMLKG